MKVQIFKTLLLASLMLSVNIETLFAESNALSKKELEKYKPLKKNEGRKLKSLTTAKLSDMHLAKPVKYFDIKEYSIGPGAITRKSYEGGWSFDMAAYKKLTDKEKKKIRSVQPVMSNSPFGATYYPDSPMKSIYNLHYIDMHSKVHTIASRKELLDFLGTIDTSAEVSMALLNRYGSIRYKKVGDFYIIRSKSVTLEDYDGGDYDCYLEISHQIMDNKGSMLLIKQIKHQGYRGKKCDNLYEKW